MKEELDLVKKFHKKFNALISDKPSLIPEDRVVLRHRLMKEEVEEYLIGAKKGDIENIAKELTDVLYTVYGTIIEHGLQDRMEKIFQEVHRSQMSKDYHQYKMIKGKNYTEADIKKIIKSK
ncbi:MAG: nucleoside triphosphate pyrophosphohydrolase family protein [Patescibacteria group bacterium]|nr:nucleoside triphosphate pyrophosphohydrolase family protein [Patescibacteria group bacterium]